MKLTIFRNLSLFMMLSLLITSCIKDDVVELKDQGSTFVKILEAPGTAFYFEPFSGTRTFTALSLRRDANSSAELNKSVTVTITLDEAAIAAYNDANGTSFELLPDSLFTIGNEFTKVGDKTYQTTFAPGEFGKDFVVNLNGDKWDLAYVYALPFKIENSGGLKVTADQGESFAQISIKNKYDGVYRLTGYHNRDPYTFPYDTEIHLVTAGENSVIFYWPDAGSTGHPIGIGPDNEMSWYGPAISPVIVFDPATDLVTDVYNAGGATVITMFTGPGSRLSRYDAATKSITVDWNYANNPLRAFFDDLTYIGPR